MSSTGNKVRIPIISDSRQKPFSLEMSCVKMNGDQQKEKNLHNRHGNYIQLDFIYMEKDQNQEKDVQWVDFEQIILQNSESVKEILSNATQIEAIDTNLKVESVNSVQQDDKLNDIQSQIKEITTKPEENLQTIWFGSSSDSTLEDLKTQGNSIDQMFQEQQQLLDYLKAQSEALTTTKYILISPDSECQQLYESAGNEIEENLKIKTVLIISDDHAQNLMWTSRYSKTKSLNTLNETASDLRQSIEKVRMNQLPTRFQERDSTVDFMFSYKKYHREQHETEWSGNILDKYFLIDLKKCMEQLFDIERKVNPESQQPVTADSEEKEIRQRKEIIGDFLGEFLNEDQTEYKPEFLESLDENKFLLYYLAQKSIYMFSRVDPKLIYFVTNSIFAKEYETRFPILFPLYSLVDIGITNYNDVAGSLNLSTNQLIEHEKMRAMKREANKELVAQGKTKGKVPEKRRDPYQIAENKIKIYRGAKITRAELFQFENKCGSKMYSKSFLSATTSLMTAQEFGGIYANIPDGLVRVIFEIYIDNDFSNDIGTYTMLMSEAHVEDEWQLGPGSEFEIGEIKTQLKPHRGCEPDEDSILYIIELFKKPMSQKEFNVNLLEGCQQLDIPMDNSKSLSDMTIDDSVNNLIMNLPVFIDKLNGMLVSQSTRHSDSQFVVTALNKGISNPGDRKGYFKGNEQCVFRKDYYSKSCLDLLLKNKGKQMKMSGFTLCSTVLTQDEIDEQKNVDEKDKECVFLEIYLEKQEYLPVGISQTQFLGYGPDENGNQTWILPHGMNLQVEDYYQKTIEQTDRKMTHIILSNKIDMRKITLVDREKARESIDKVVKDKIDQSKSNSREDKLQF